MGCTCSRRTPASRLLVTDEPDFWTKLLESGINIGNDHFFQNMPGGHQALQGPRRNWQLLLGHRPRDQRPKTICKHFQIGACSAVGCTCGNVPLDPATPVRRQRRAPLQPTGDLSTVRKQSMKRKHNLPRKLTVPSRWRTDLPEPFRTGLFNKQSTLPVLMFKGVPGSLAEDLFDEQHSCQSHG